jgi:hypothetical protein
MDLGDWIAVLALVVAIVSFVANLYFTRQERRARTTEIDLLRRQVEGEDAERDERRRARISAEQGPTSGGERTDEFTFTVTNLGPSVVRDVDLKVRTLANEDATPRVQVATGMLVGDPREVRIEVPRAFSRRRDLVLWARWRDDLDDHEEGLVVIEPLT